MCAAVARSVDLAFAGAVHHRQAPDYPSLPQEDHRNGNARCPRHHVHRKRRLFCLPIGKLEDRAILARWKPANGIDDQVYMEATIAFEIAFDDATIPTIAGHPVITICEGIITSVERVMELIESTLS